MVTYDYIAVECIDTYDLKLGWSILVCTMYLNQALLLISFCFAWYIITNNQLSFNLLKYDKLVLYTI